MRPVPSHALWIGNAGDIRPPTAVLDAGICAVIDLAMDEPVALLPRDLVYCRYPLLDGEGNPEWLLKAAIETVVRLLHQRVPTLVCCSGGMSRSVLIAATALSRVTDRPLDQWLGELTSGPTDLSPTLLTDLTRIA